MGDARDRRDDPPRGQHAATAADRGRAAVLMHVLTDLPDNQIRAAIDKLSPAQRDRLNDLAEEILKDHADLFGP